VILVPIDGLWWCGSMWCVDISDMMMLAVMICVGVWNTCVLEL